MTAVLTRDELFEKVWHRPMTKVAAEYRISDVALKKICVKHRIPVPGRGYWARKAAGQKVKKAIFRSVADPVINRIVIIGSPLANLPPAVKLAKATARAREKRNDNRIEVKGVPDDPRPMVQRFQKRVSKAKPGANGLISVAGAQLFDVAIAPASLDRVVAFLDAFVRAAEARGYRPVKGEGRLAFLVDDEPLNFKITELVDRVEHVSTESERRALEKWEKRRRRRVQSWDYVDWTQQPDIPEWDHVPNGRLRVRIDERSYTHDGIRRTFADGKAQRIEKLINAILEGLATCSAATKAKRAEDERRRLEREEREKRWREAQQREALETKRIEALSNDMERWRRRREILDYVSVVEERLENAPAQEREVVGEWIAWVKAYADRLDPLKEGLPRLLSGSR